MAIVRKITPNKRKTPFENTWPAFWFDKVPGNAIYTPFQVTGDSQPGFHVADSWRFIPDINYEFSSYTSDDTETFYQAGSWTDRDSGTFELGSFKIPYDLIIPDTDGIDTPNNPAIILNRSTGDVKYVNAFCRSVAGGPFYGYEAKIDDIAVPGNHGGSYLAGGYITLRKLTVGINHGIALNVQASKYLSSDGTGFVSPALHADDGYDDPMDFNYYGGNITTIKMGSRFAIPPGVTSGDLGISTPAGLVLFNAAQTYGFYIVDNTGWDNLALNCTEDAESALNACQADQALILAAVELVS